MLPRAAPQAALPTTVLGGFLGAGKTTLVNHLLRHAGGRRIMVMVNDFGEVAIDPDLILGQAGDVLALANGCACCSTGGDLARALTMILDGPARPDHLLIEASGVADPDRLADIARADRDLRLNGVIVVADAGHIEALVADPRLGRQVREQLATAHLVILNKQDRGAPEGLVERLRRLAPAAAFVPAVRGAVPADLVLGELAPERSWRARAVLSPNHAASFARWVRLGGPPMSLAALKDVLGRVPVGVLRLKGFVRLEDGGAALIQLAGPDWTLMPQPERGGTRLFAIGLEGELDAVALDALFPAGHT